MSNNIFSLYGTTSFGNKSRLSEQKNYQKAKDSIIARKISYLQDKDVFNRLVPFWQLQLYFAGVGNYKDFYPDLLNHFVNKVLRPGLRVQSQEQRTGETGDEILPSLN
nr:M60 family metallopeptidase [Paraflavitalea speifideiaquila]